MNRTKDQVDEARSGVRETMERAADQARHGYEQIQTRVGDTVHDRPGMSLAAAFGLGVVAGVGLSLLLFDHESEPISHSYTRRAEDFGRKFWDSIAQSLPESLSRRA
jgi:hypothetical protein